MTHPFSVVAMTFFYLFSSPLVRFDYTCEVFFLFFFILVQ